MQLAATIAVVVSVLMLAYQGRELAGHTRVANEVAGTDAHRELIFHWKAIVDVFIQRPELRAHYYGHASAAPSETDSVRLNVIAEQHADWLEAGTVSIAQLRSYTHIEDLVGTWHGFIAGEVDSSPTLRSWIRANPGMNPPLDPFLASYDAAHAGGLESPPKP
jgi:hypothetical protein